MIEPIYKYPVRLSETETKYLNAQEALDMMEQGKEVRALGRRYGSYRFSKRPGSDRVNFWFLNRDEDWQDGDWTVDEFIRKMSMFDFTGDGKTLYVNEGVRDWWNSRTKAELPTDGPENDDDEDDEAEKVIPKFLLGRLKDEMPPEGMDPSKKLVVLVRIINTDIVTSCNDEKKNGPTLMWIWEGNSRRAARDVINDRVQFHVNDPERKYRYATYPTVDQVVVITSDKDMTKTDGGNVIIYEVVSGREADRLGAMPFPMYKPTWV